MSDNNRPFYKQTKPCGLCGEVVEVQEAFYHWIDRHERELVLNAHYVDDRCAKCGEVLPRITSGNEGYQKRFKHFREKHDIEVVETD